MAAGLGPDPLGSLQRSPDPLAGLRVWGPREQREERTEGVRREGGNGKGKGEGKRMVKEKGDREGYRGKVVVETTR